MKIFFATLVIFSASVCLGGMGFHIEGKVKSYDKRYITVVGKNSVSVLRRTELKSRVVRYLINNKGRNVRVTVDRVAVVNRFARNFGSRRLK